MPTVARRVLVSGRVQGVGFRWFSSQAARELGLAGWVRNLRDGRVEAWLEGQPESVEELLTRIRRARPPARVDECLVEERDPAGHAGFQVER